MKVKLIAITSYIEKPPFFESGTEALIEHAGRICYRSSSLLGGAATKKFIERRIEQGHESIVEHAVCSFEISEISRACSHQLVRHRLCSFSQESQRFVDMSDPHLDWVVPADIASNEDATRVWTWALQIAKESYRKLRQLGIKKQDARFLLPNATATRLLMTANFRQWRHVFKVRISPHAQWEIREVCTRMLEQVHPYAPSVFGDLLPLLEKTT